MVMMRRSPFTGVVAGAVLAGPSVPAKIEVSAGSAPAKRVPQRWQNLAAAGFSAEHDGQLRVSAVPHFMQYCASARFCVWQLPQSMAGAVGVRRS
jgi:hypothetical protein